MDFVVFSAAQASSVLALNRADVAVQPRAVDGASAPAALTGKWVAPAAVLNDPEYLALAPALVTYLRALPIVSADPALVFAPAPAR